MTDPTADETPDEGTVTITVDPGLAPHEGSDLFARTVKALADDPALAIHGGNRLTVSSSGFDSLASDDGLLVMDAPELSRPSSGHEVRFDLPTVKGLPGAGGPARTPLAPGEAAEGVTPPPKARQKRRGRRTTKATTAADAIVAPTEALEPASTSDDDTTAPVTPDAASTTEEATTAVATEAPTPEAPAEEATPAEPTEGPTPDPEEG